MRSTSRFSPDPFAGPSHSIAPQQNPPAPSFEPALEAHFQRFRLTSNRELIRATSALAVLIAIVRAVEHAIRGPWNGILLLDFALVISASVIVASIAWSSFFERHYLPWARIVVPLRNAIVTAHIVEAATRGQLEVLMGLPLMLFGAFFFFGLRFPSALVSGLLTVASFVAAAIYFHLALPVGLRSLAFLLMAVIACALAARHIERWARAGFLEENRVANLAQHDALTATKNRRVFDEHLSRLWQQAMEDDRPIAILMIDVDHFKAYNDRYGHQAGDQTLRRIAQTAQRFIHRPLDILARYGGEEFAVILYDAESDYAKEVASRICRAVFDLAIEHRESKTGAMVTISAGVAVIRPTLERNPRGAVQLADQALYEAKVRGRNRIHVMADADHSALVTGVFATPLIGRNP